LLVNENPGFDLGFFLAHTAIMSPVARGLVVCLAIAIVLLGLWFKYADFLKRGQEAPESTKILSEIEKNGVPDFSISDLAGKTVTLRDFRGKILIVNFWASWCEPCIQEFPSMLKLVDTMKGEVALLAVSADYEKADIEPFLKALKVNSPFIWVVWDKNQELAKSFGTFKLPESYILDGQGQLIRKVAGVEDWASSDAVAYFKDLVRSRSDRDPSK